MILRSFSPRRCIGAVLIGLLPLLAGCGGLLPDPPQRQLYRLNPPLNFSTGLPRIKAQLVVDLPISGSGLDTSRIALSVKPNALDYYAGAEWAGRVPSMVQTALVEAFEKSAAVPAVASDASGLHADFLVDTTIRDFEAVYDSPDKPARAVIRLDVRLVQMPQQKIIAQTSFSAEAAASGKDVADSVPAFDAALGNVLQQIVTWTVTNPALSKSR
jgi:cholesterol transport system auxiliary component